MKASKVLREAAKRIDRRADLFCCCAIDWVGGSSTEFISARDKAREYFSMFKPEGLSMFWFGDDNPSNRHARVMALLFAAEVAKADGN